MSRIVRPWRQAEPYHHGLRDHLRDVREILAPFAVMALIVAAWWLWMAIGAAAQVRP